VETKVKNGGISVRKRSPSGASVEGLMLKVVSRLEKFSTYTEFPFVHDFQLRVCLIINYSHREPGMPIVAICS